MMAIFEYTLQPVAQQIVVMHESSRIRDIQILSTDIILSVESDDTKPLSKKTIFFFKVGPLPDGAIKCIGSAQIKGVIYYAYIT